MMNLRPTLLTARVTMAMRVEGFESAMSHVGRGLCDPASVPWAGFALQLWEAGGRKAA